MRAYFSRRYTISASHRLHSEAFTEEQNAAMFGKCNNPHGHGHNYVVEVTVGGQVDGVTGMVCNMVDLDRCVQKEVLERFDHENLNLCAEFADLVPTTENLSIRIYGLLKAAIGSAELIGVRIEETRNNSFECMGG
ncbi:MAG TPA: 6-carboxytetrahydropterin synthase [Acidisarcina sp.]